MLRLSLSTNLIIAVSTNQYMYFFIVALFHLQESIKLERQLLHRKILKQIKKVEGKVILLTSYFLPR
jgi:hypothetical protein